MKKRIAILFSCFILALPSTACKNDNKADENSNVTPKLTKENVSDHIKEITLKYNDSSDFKSENYSQEELESEKSDYGTPVSEEFLQQQRMGIAILQETAGYFGITLEELLLFMSE